MTHLIKKQVIDCTISKRLDAFRVQHQLSQVYWNALLPAIEKAFDEVDNSDEVIVIDKLEIDLGQLTQSHLTQKEWITDLQHTLAKELKASLSGPLQQQQKNNLRRSRIIHTGRQWLFYIQHGYLPWNAMNITPHWHQQALEALAADFDSVQELRKLIRSNPRVIQRIIHQYDARFLTSLLEVLTAKKNDAVNNIIEELYLVYQQVPSFRITTGLLTKEDFRKTIMATVLAAAAQQAVHFSSQPIAKQLLMVLVKTQPVARAIQQILSGKLPIIEPILEKILTALPTALITPASSGKETDAATVTTKENSEDLFEKGSKAVDEKPFEEPVAASMEKEGIFTDLAGLVLLHPFLVSLFKQLEWVEGKKFLNKECQQRAILLLHFLATGEMSAPEYALIIPKVLCGHPLQEPLPSTFELSPSIIEEAEHLLQVVIQRWEVLKSTSIAGFREGFLQRKGQLHKEEYGLRLQVEQGSFDMLLDQLPWGIGMIKLPWMKDLLKVEWR